MKKLLRQYQKEATIFNIQTSQQYFARVRILNLTSKWVTVLHHWKQDQICTAARSTVRIKNIDYISTLEEPFNLAKDIRVLDKHPVIDQVD
jgi:hypothetical protein